MGRRWVYCSPAFMVKSIHPHLMGNKTSLVSNGIHFHVACIHTAAAFAGHAQRRRVVPRAASGGSTGGAMLHASQQAMCPLWPPPFSRPVAYAGKIRDGLWLAGQGAPSLAAVAQRRPRGKPATGSTPDTDATRRDHDAREPLQLLHRVIVPSKISVCHNPARNRCPRR